MTATITGPLKPRIEDCEQVLRALPDYFGIEEALVQYLEDIKTRPTFHAYLDGRLVVFLSITRHTQDAAEIHVMGVLPDRHRQGIGSVLVQAAERVLLRDGISLLEVKTLGEAHPDKNYKRTRACYKALGFFSLEELPDFWGKGLPTLFMVKPLNKEPNKPDAGDA